MSERDLTFKKSLDLSLSIESARAASTELAQSQKTLLLMLFSPVRVSQDNGLSHRTLISVGGVKALITQTVVVLETNRVIRVVIEATLVAVALNIERRKSSLVVMVTRLRVPTKVVVQTNPAFQGAAHGKSKGRGYTKPQKTHNIHSPENNPSVMAEDVYFSDPEKESDHDFIWALNHIGQERHSFKVDAQLDGKTIPLELDTGSEASIMPANM